MLLTLLAPAAHAFCGTYVGPLGSALTNDTATVVLARQGTTTTLTLANNVSGDTGDFALVIPVPEVLGADDVRIVDPTAFDALDAYSAPRVVSYTCDDFYYDDADTADSADTGASTGDPADGVTVEAEFQVGEYDIAVLSAEGGDGLVSWLDANGFSVDAAAAPVLDEYIAGGQYFIAAKVHLDTLPGGAFLSPLQFTYHSDMWTLPIRIGTTVSGGEQQVVIYALTDDTAGKTQISNYTEATLEDECLFPDGTMDYEGFFQGQLDAAFAGDALWLTEYAWPASGCDPCSSDPPSAELLASLGVTWSDVYFTRLRARYTPEEATQDLVLYSSGIVEFDQVRFIEYADYLESIYPVCGLGMVDDPASCEDYGYGDTGDTEDTAGTDDTDDTADTGTKTDDSGCGCASTGAPVGWLAGLGALLLARRRRA